jgi:DNA-binding transcriptional ArsR family regulator
VASPDGGAVLLPGRVLCPGPCAPDASRVIYNQMVVELPDPALDRLFRALADPSRRDILRRTMAAPVSVSQLAASYQMSFAAVQKHVAVLEAAGLIQKTPQGRERLVRADPSQLARAREALTELEALWHARFSQLDAILTPPLE